VSRLRRFLHIERSRPGAPESEPDAAVARRFGGVERPVAPGTPARSGADLERFAPPPLPSLELDPAAAGERPFTRCAACGMDHHVNALECSGCGARLDTEACRAFNEALWQERLAEAAREAVVDAERRAARAEAEEAAARDRRSAAEELAREVGKAERQRLDRELGRGADVVRAGQRLLAWLMRGR
jgi:hypothetical protein